MSTLSEIRLGPKGGIIIDHLHDGQRIEVLRNPSTNMSEIYCYTRTVVGLEEQFLLSYVIRIPIDFVPRVVDALEAKV